MVVLVVCMNLDSIVFIVFIVFFLEAYAEDEGVGDVVDLEVID